MKDKNVMLIGFMGTGKTTVSQKLALDHGMHEIDLDSYIVDREKMNITDIFAEMGEEGFRDIETDCLKDVVDRTGNIVSCGGGSVLRDENVELMKKNGVIVLLTETPETVFERVKDDNTRPLLNGNMNIEFITELMRKREDRYKEVADVVVDTDGKSIQEIADEISQQVGL